jgi:coenzyme F420-0:L-glutamate ligase/coenzyme F420-1:gamma-L-glutamate ligase
MQVDAVVGMPTVAAGDDLAAVVTDHATLDSDAVVCIASTVVSKSEGRTRALEAYEPSSRAHAIAARLEAVTGSPKDPRFAEAVLRESAALLLEAPFLLTQTHFGHITVNAGIDRSNTDGADLLLLPEDPSASAQQIAAGLPTDRVIITDTCGRPFRHGQRGVAIGWHGLHPARDWRGESDRSDRLLSSTVENVIDELAAAANLVMGEGAGGTPVAVITGFEWGDHGASDAHFRAPETDLIRQALEGWTYDG